MLTRSIPRQLASAVLLMVIAASTLMQASPRARADAPPVAISMDTVTPATLTPQSTISITGSIKNTSDTPISLVQVYLWHAGEPITTLSQFHSITSGPLAKPVGKRVVELGAWQVITDTSNPTLDPGETAVFSVGQSAATLGLTTSGAVYMLGVHVRGQPQGSVNQTVGRSRVLLPMPATGNSQAIVPVVSLTSRPSLVAPMVFRDDHLVDELRGRLRTLLDAALRTGGSFVVDPALIDEITALAGDSTIQQQPSSSPAVPAAEIGPLATAWLDDFGRLTESGDGYRLPYGAPVTGGLTTADASVVLQRSRTALADNNPATELPLALWPADGAASAAQLSQYNASLSARLVLASNVNTLTPRRTAGTTVIPYDPQLYQGLPQDGEQSTAQIRGRVASQLLLGGVSGQPQVVMLDTSEDLERLQQASSNLLPSSLADLTAAAILSPVSFSAGTVVSGQELLANVTASKGSFAFWSELTQSPLAGQRSARTLSRAMSSGWQSSDQAGMFLEDAVAALVGPSGNPGVNLSISDSFVLPSEENTVPMTITNRLDETVHVQVTFISENPQRISVPDTDSFPVSPGSSATVTFNPVAHDNGATRITAQLRTLSGKPVGEPRSFTVQANSLGQVGWIIVIAAGALLLGTTALRIRQVRARWRAGRASKESSTIDEARQADE